MAHKWSITIHMDSFDHEGSLVLNHESVEMSLGERRQAGTVGKSSDKGIIRHKIRWGLIEV